MSYCHPILITTPWVMPYNSLSYATQLPALRHTTPGVTISISLSYILHLKALTVKNPDGGSDTPVYLNVRATSRSDYIPSTMRGEGLGESGGALLQGKGGRGGFRRIIFLISIFEKK